MAGHDIDAPGREARVEQQIKELVKHQLASTELLHKIAKSVDRVVIAVEALAKKG